jgi:hypothetical protein
MFTLKLSKMCFDKFQGQVFVLSTFAGPQNSFFVLSTFAGPQNSFSSRFLGFYLYVSNTPNKLDETLCFHDTNYTTANIPSVLDISCPVHGRYVIYYNERQQGVNYPDDYSEYAFNELCEVEVYGKSQ